MPVKVPLTKGYYAIIDEADAPRVLAMKWWAIFSARKVYAEGIINGRRIRMHRFILQGSPQHIDHIDGDGLNNQRSNLRNCTPGENARNKHNYSTLNVSGVLGVSRSRNHKSWRAGITVNGRHIYLGQYKTVEEAAQVRRHAELKYFGEFAPVESQWEPKERPPKYVAPVKPKRIPKVKVVKVRRDRKAIRRDWADTLNSLTEALVDYL